MLSREAVVSLRSPLYTGLSQEPFACPQKQWLAGKWHISHSTHPERYSGNGDLSPVVVVSTADLGWPTGSASAQDQEKITTVFPAFTDLDSPTIVSLTDKNITRMWDILAWGKEGQLESWMIEDGSGWISDTSGEARADWRNSYLVVFLDHTIDIEIWERFGPTRPLSDETVGKIRDALEQVRRPREFGELVEQLKPVSP